MHAFASATCLRWSHVLSFVLLFHMLCFRICICVCIFADSSSFPSLSATRARWSYVRQGNNSVAISSFLWLFRLFLRWGNYEEICNNNKYIDQLSLNLLFFLVCYLCQVLKCPGGREGEDTSVGSRAARRPVSVFFTRLPRGENRGWERLKIFFGQTL